VVHKSLSGKIVAFCLLVLILLAGCGKNDYVAKVNGEIITQAELDKRVASMKAMYELQGISFEGEQGEALSKILEEEVLNQLIQETVLKQEMERQGIKLDEKKAEEQIAKIEETYGKDTFNKLLQAQNTSRKDLIKQTAYQLALDELYGKVTADIKVTDEEAEQYFNDNKDNLVEVKVSHILASAEKDSATEEERKAAKQKAEGWIAKLKAGAEFTELAKKESDEPGAESSGGSLDGYFSRLTSNYVQEFTDAAFEIPEGSFSETPVETDFGYHVIKVEDRKDTFAELKDDVVATLTTNKKNEKFNTFLDELMEKADIENKLAAEAEKETSNSTETEEKNTKQ